MLPDLRSPEKYLPTQPFHRANFDGAEDKFVAALYEAICETTGLRPPAEEFRLRTTREVPVELLASTPVTLRFLQVLMRLARPQRALEVGAFIGISSMYLAKALPPGGRLTTIEKYAHFAAVARENFVQNGLADRIELLEGDAHEVLRGLSPGASFQLAFLDGNKERYAEYVDLIHPRLAAGGLLVVDDVFAQGDILNDTPRTEKGAGVRRLLDRVSHLRGYQRCMLPLGNGMLLLLKDTEAR